MSSLAVNIIAAIAVIAVLFIAGPVAAIVAAIVGGIVAIRAASAERDRR